MCVGHYTVRALRGGGPFGILVSRETFLIFLVPYQELSAVSSIAS